MLAKVTHRARARFLNCFMQDANRDYRATVLVAGSGRSGTTWLAEMINRTNDFRMIFEPFNDVKIPEARLFLRRQYLDPALKNEIYLRYVTRVLSGEFRHPWADMFNRKIRVEKRIVKVIRASFFLKWIRVNFPQLRIVYIMRHPFPVAISKSTLGFGTCVPFLFRQPEILEFLDVDISQEEVEKLPVFLQHIFLWCVENAFVLKGLVPGDYCVLAYEHLRSRERLVFEKLARYVGEPHLGGSAGAADKPSMSAKTSTQSIEERFATIPNDQLERALSLVELFELDSFYGAQPGCLKTPEQLELGIS